ncbi:polyhydroxyalkanoate synthesis repressor PhaR [Xanthomonas arboricola]|nr:polyhydroxyalkanoate synthesis repressor PhaR [Xanthomonas sp. 4461]
MSERSMAGLRIIKKYPNRRLYDTEISSYITIEDVRQLIIDGEEFEVRDAKSGEDLSRAVLLQIIADREQDGEPMLSTQLLSQIIRFYGDSLQGFMGNYLERSMQVFLDQQQQFRQQMGNLLGQTPWAMMNQLTERNLELWQEFQRNFGAGFGRPGGPGTPPTPPGAGSMGSGPMGTGTHGGASSSHTGTTGKARNRG